MEKEQFEKLVDTMLTDMKQFKQLVRKSLNLLQGMELMQSGYVFGVNSATGGPVTTAANDGAGATVAAAATQDHGAVGGGGGEQQGSGLDKVMEER